LNSAQFLRIPRGVKEAVDTLMWDGALFNGDARTGNYVVLPASFEKFSGNSWKCSAVTAMGFTMDCADAVALDTLKAVINASDLSYEGTSSNLSGATMKYWLGNAFSSAVVLGEGSTAGFYYGLFPLIGF
jgi:hypothetical protein